jgi:DNA-binding transcriptional regulator YiaG
MIITADDVKAAKKQLGMSVYEIAEALRLSSTTGSTTVRRWINGRTQISGPAAVALEAMLAGYEPEYLGDYDDD